ncbi:MAG: hypothetical protein HOO06_01860 [Bdellovibrionaceae bacterium]|nr:hypothetical protein [Pseudobdellovibrionaceae bacterium]
MRTFVIIFVVLFSMMFAHSSFATGKTPKAKSFVHKVELGDVGVIESKAPTHSAAFRQSASTCFDRRLALYEKHRGVASEDVQLDIIDACANLKW